MGIHTVQQFASGIQHNGVHSVLTSLRGGCILRILPLPACRNRVATL